MRRIADREYTSTSAGYPSSGTYDFQTQYSPFITWIRRSCLGLKDSESKTHDSVSADWILEAPESWRTPFLQGVCDGDGCASLKSQYLSIGTTPNSEFYRKLLESFGIKSHDGDGAVVVSGMDNVKRAHEVGMFRYAASRKENLEKLTKMIESYDNSRRITDNEMQFIRDSRFSGKSWGSISEGIFDRHGYTWPYYTIMRRARKHGIK